ncbi:type I-E CRISPR-associated protein Cas6/Cse3/CasE, partial [Tamilnaduibacter salinus]|uniref:type I-E CRISPR-associated protein Cas6/Cse3/CasE n=1 Tax=Tamilnaduibacter salinus TaxID=1484056 RepID=UPI001B80899E
MKLLSGDAYANHQLLWRLFTQEEERPFLFRQEMEKDQLDSQESPRGLPLFYVLSSREPEPVPGLLECQSKPFDPKLSPGDRSVVQTARQPHSGPQNRRQKNAPVVMMCLMDAKWQCRQQGRSAPW